MIKSFDKKFFWIALRVFLPIIMAGIIQAAVGFVDNIAVSGSTIHDGAGAGMDKIDLKAVGAGNEIFFLMSSFGMAFTVLFAVLFSQFSNKQKDFAETFKLSIWFVTIVTIVVSLMSFLFAEELMGLFFGENTTPDQTRVIKHGSNFIRIISLGNIFQAFALNLVNPLVIKGKVKYPLYLSLISLTLNLSLDLLFIYGFKLGAEGSAWATDISYIVQFIITFGLVLKHKEWFKGSLNIFIIHKIIFRQINKRLPLFIFFVLMQSAFAITTILWTALYGSEYLAGITVGYIVSNLMFVTFGATTKGVSIFVGPLLGQNKMKKAKETSKKLIWPNIFICVVAMIMAGIVTLFFPRLMLNSNSDIWNAQWLIISFIIALPGYMGVTFFSAMFEVGGMQIIPNTLNRGHPLWAQIPCIIIFSPMAVNLPWMWAFFIMNITIYISLIVIIFEYRKFKWLRQIKTS